MRLSAAILLLTATLLLPGCKPKPEAAIQGWDNIRIEWNDSYKRVRIEWDVMDRNNRSYADSENDLLHALGGAGWQLVDTQRDQENRRDILFFKRPTRENSQSPIVYIVK